MNTVLNHQHTAMWPRSYVHKIQNFGRLTRKQKKTIETFMTHESNIQHQCHNKFLVRCSLALHAGWECMDEERQARRHKMVTWLMDARLSFKHLHCDRNLHTLLKTALGIVHTLLHALEEQDSSKELHHTLQHMCEEHKSVLKTCIWNRVSSFVKKGVPRKHVDTTCNIVMFLMKHQCN